MIFSMNLNPESFSNQLNITHYYIFAIEKSLTLNKEVFYITSRQKNYSSTLKQKVRNLIQKFDSNNNGNGIDIDIDDA